MILPKSSYNTPTSPRSKKKRGSYWPAALVFLAVWVGVWYCWYLSNKSEKVAKPSIAAQAQPAPRDFNKPIWEVDGCKVYRRTLGVEPGDARVVHIVKGENCSIFIRD